MKNKDLLRIKNDAFYEELSEIVQSLRPISEDIKGTHDDIKQKAKQLSTEEPID